MTILSNTHYDWRIDLIKNHAKIGEARFSSCSVDFVENADVTRTMKVKIPVDGFEVKNIYIKRNEEEIFFDGSRRFDGSWCFTSINGIWVSTDNQFDMFADRLRPVMIINDVEYSLGDYMIIGAPLESDGKEYFYNIEAYDETMIVKQSALTERKYFAAGTEYMTVLSELLISCGISRILGDDTHLAITVDHEYALGTSILEIVNDLLEEINYSPIYAGSDGYVFLSQNKAKVVGDYTYTDRNSTLIDSIKTDTDIFSLPNVIVGYTSSPDTTDVLKYTKVNDDPRSAISVGRRGYNVVEAIQLDDCPDLATLKQLVNFKYVEATQATETVTISTMPDGDHTYGSYVNLSHDDTSGLYREIGWTIDFCGTMKHTLRRKVFV